MFSFGEERKDFYKTLLLKIKLIDHGCGMCCDDLIVILVILFFQFLNHFLAKIDFKIFFRLFVL